MMVEELNSKRTKYRNILDKMLVKHLDANRLLYRNIFVNKSL